MFEAFKPSLRRILHVRPLLSIVVVGYSMQRELPRTLETLSADYQRWVSGSVYEVIVVAGNGSEPAAGPFATSALSRCLYEVVTGAAWQRISVPRCESRC